VVCHVLFHPITLTSHGLGLDPRQGSVLRAHHLIRKVPHTHRYLLTDAGRIAVTALITARYANAQELTKIAA